MYMQKLDAMLIKKKDMEYYNRYIDDPDMGELVKQLQELLA